LLNLDPHFVSPVKTPVFNNAYTAKGTLYIPYAEIREPFYAWFDAKSGKSRIDYYGGNCLIFIHTRAYKL
jgi:hypothetical protein